MRQALEMALAALEAALSDDKPYIENSKQAITAIKQVLAQPEQEPVAWLHTKIEGVAVPHRPADLDKHPDRWEALYKTPSPCPTCEALARTVMLDQTSYDTTPPQRTWVGLTRAERFEIEKAMSKYYDYQHECKTVCLPEFAAAIEAKLKEKNT